jgi:hypothetical protein
LAARIMFDFGEIVPGVGLRISIDRIIVENAYDLRHVELPLIWRRNRKCFVVKVPWPARGGGIILVFVAEQG